MPGCQDARVPGAFLSLLPAKPSRGWMQGGLAHPRCISVDLGGSWWISVDLGPVEPVGALLSCRGPLPGPLGSLLDGWDILEPLLS